MAPDLYLLVGGAAIALVALLAFWFLARPDLRQTLDAQRQLVTQSVERWFVVQPCFRCFEFRMRLLVVSPNGRSVHYQCEHCGKKMHAPAGTPDAPRLIAQLERLAELVDQYEKQFGKPEDDDTAEFSTISFATPAAPLPYEQTTRTPIPEAVRAEVWRRDGGQCVNCRAKRNLQFDHIIPVSRGGANTVANLQLLCQSCNATKGDQV